ncbi:MAG: hypothetical protein AAB068_02950, partial [Pseudomonadota bacterium]
PNDPSATGYMPISCDLHSEYELAILRRQWLRLAWVNGDVIHNEVVLPLDLKTARHDDSRDGGRSGPSRPSRGITPSLEGRGRTASGDGRDAGGTTPGMEEVGPRRERRPRETPGAVAGTAVEEYLVCRAKNDTTREIRLDHARRTSAT